MNWQLVFDIGAQSTERFLPFVYIGLGLLAVAGGLRLWARRRKQGSFMAIMLAIAAVLVGGLGYGLNAWDHHRLVARLKSGDVLQTQGAATAHQKWRQDIGTSSNSSTRRYNHWETVTVGGVAFTWSPGEQQAAFSNAQTPPLALQDGLMLRISYVEDVAGQAHERRILRLEVQGGGGLKVQP